MSFDHYISEKDVRKCQFYLRYMDNRKHSEIRVHRVFNRRDNCENVEEICYWINTALDYTFKGNERDRGYFVNKMEASCKDRILPLVKFDWIKNDKRICLWLWYKNIGYRRRLGDVFPEHLGRFDAIVEYFDTMNNGGYQKKESLDNAKGDWQRKWNTPDPFNKENIEAINYLWDSAVKLHSNIIQYFSPITDDDRKICLTGFYDCILDTPEKKELFLRKIKSALSSHKHREKAGKDHINKKFLLSLENDKKLNDMIALAGAKRDDFMNRLIAEEYERHKITNRQS